jgi:hypothetical protein
MALVRVDEMSSCPHLPIENVQKRKYRRGYTIRASLELNVTVDVVSQRTKVGWTFSWRRNVTWRPREHREKAISRKATIQRDKILTKI